MSAYVVVHATPKDADKMQEYGAGAAPTVEAHGGKFITRGPATVLSGDSSHKVLVVLEFPSKAQAETWYNSAEYQALIPTRKAAMDAVFVLGGE